MSPFVRVASGLIGVALLCLGVFLVATVIYLAWSEVVPALRQGTLSVETTSMILNIVWEGNAIYLLLLAYLAVAGGLAYGAIRCFRAAFASK
jgi:hypothetical protein